MPTTRRRRSRTPQYSVVVSALLAHEPIERTLQNRQELEQLRCQGYLESPGREYPFLVGWAAREIERWDLETH